MPKCREIVVEFEQFEDEPKELTPVVKAKYEPETDTLTLSNARDPEGPSLIVSADTLQAINDLISSGGF